MKQVVVRGVTPGPGSKLRRIARPIKMPAITESTIKALRVIQRMKNRTLAEVQNKIMG